MSERKFDDFGREMPYDTETMRNAIEWARRWRDNPEKEVFVAGAVLPLLQAYEKVYSDNVRYLLQQQADNEALDA